MQFYSGNFLDGSTQGQGRTTYNQYASLCLETQKFPNSINVPAWKNEVILKPGETYKTRWCTSSRLSNRTHKSQAAGTLHGPAASVLSVAIFLPPSRQGRQGLG